MDDNGTLEFSTVDPADIKFELLRKTLDDFFLVINAVIICLMQGGFACLEAGSVRAKNVTNIMIKNMIDLFICAFWYWLIGYTLAFGTGSSFLGMWKFRGAGQGLEENKAYAHWFFQFTFAATSATIVSGALAERCSYIGYLVYSSVVTGFVYPVVSHWAWAPEGWLYTLGFYDFAGSGVVHLVGGVASLIGAIILGPRIGRFPKKKEGVEETEEEEGEFAGHSTALVGIGGMLLIVGFFGFNGGSLLHITLPGDGDRVGRILANTAMAAAGGGLTGMFCTKTNLPIIGQGHWSFLATVNCMLCGMVCVCACVDQFELWAALLMGVLACVFYFIISFCVRRLKIDDPVDAVAVHMGGGMWGLLGGPLLRADGLPAHVTEVSRLGIAYNAIGMCAIIAWTMAICLVMFVLLKVTGNLRASEAEEIIGNDITKHGEPGYPGPPWHNLSAGWIRKNLSQAPGGFAELGVDPLRISRPALRNPNNNAYDNTAFVETRD